MTQPAERPEECKQENHMRKRWYNLEAKVAWLRVADAKNRRSRALMAPLLGAVKIAAVKVHKYRDGCPPNHRPRDPTKDAFMSNPMRCEDCGRRKEPWHSHGVERDECDFLFGEANVPNFQTKAARGHQLGVKKQAI